MEQIKEKNVAVVVAAGSGKRMNSAIKKQYLLIQNKPILYYSLKALEDSFIDEIILVTSEDEIEHCREEIVHKYGLKKITQIVAGGKERYHSVYNGLLAVRDCDYVYIQDGARPFLTGDILLRNLASVREHKACVTGMPVKDTIKIADGDGFVSSTPNRKLVWQVQTPQTFYFPLILSSYQKYFEDCDNTNITDDAMIIEKYAGLGVQLVLGSYDNIKITTPEDLVMAEAIISGQK